MTETDILVIWNKMRSRHSAIRSAAVRFSFGQNVRISKGKLKFSKSGEQNYTTEIFRISKVVRRVPHSVYELQDLPGKHIDG